MPTHARGDAEGSPPLRTRLAIQMKTQSGAGEGRSRWITVKGKNKKLSLHPSPPPMCCLTGVTAANPAGGVPPPLRLSQAEGAGQAGRHWPFAQRIPPALLILRQSPKITPNQEMGLPLAATPPRGCASLPPPRLGARAAGTDVGREEEFERLLVCTELCRCGEEGAAGR